MLKYCNSKSILHSKHFCLSFNSHYVSIPVLSKVLSCKQLTCLKVQMYCDLDILMSVTFFCKCEQLSWQRELLSLSIWIYVLAEPYPEPLVNHSVGTNLQFSYIIKTTYLEAKTKVSSPGGLTIIPKSTKKKLCAHAQL